MWKIVRLIILRKKLSKKHLKCRILRSIAKVMRYDEKTDRFTVNRWAYLNELFAYDVNMKII